jgi:aspartate aminotransferase-like enzyme
MGRPALGHRSPEFKTVLERVFPALQNVFRTRQPVLLYTASGTGAMEAAMVNVLNPGDLVLSVCCGVFSERWAEVGEAIGCTVERLSVPPGQANLPELLEARLAQDTDKKIKAVTLIHSETSTGVLNPIHSLVHAVRSHGALSLVDAVTSLGASPFYFDQWGVDVAISGSQKGFMIPPGLSFLAMSERAMAVHKSCKAPGYYFNWTKTLKAQAEFTTPYTPATHLILALDEALKVMETEGMEAIWTRHHQNQLMVREGVKALGLELFVPEDIFASQAATSVLPPKGVEVSALRKHLKAEFGIIVADGQKSLKGKIFRIGHLGYIHQRDVLATLAALDKTLNALRA